MDTTDFSHLLKLYLAAIAMFALQTVYFAIAIIHSEVLSIQFAASSLANVGQLDLTTIRLSFIALFMVPSAILALLTYYKLYRSLKTTSTSTKLVKWNKVLAVCGFFYGLVIGGLILLSAYGKIKNQTEKNRGL